jgi:hypothetical protein
MVLNFFADTHHPGARARALACIAAAGTALLLSACGGGSSPGASTSATAAAAGSPASEPVLGSTAPVGAGGAASEVAIVAQPASGPCAASGTTASQSPQLNSSLNCAP